MADRPTMTVAEAGRIGGSTTRDRHGKEFYSQIGHDGGTASKAVHGKAFYVDIGKKGGRSCFKKHGLAHYSEMGKKGGAASHRGRKAMSQDQPVEETERENVEPRGYEKPFPTMPSITEEGDLSAPERTSEGPDMPPGFYGEEAYKIGVVNN